jgi:hypothetical protein
MLAFVGAVLCVLASGVSSWILLRRPRARFWGPARWFLLGCALLGLALVLAGGQ